MGADKPVRSCLCFPYTFAEVKAEAEHEGWTTVEEITDALGCGSGCGLCRPYLVRMLQTGETAFAILPAQSQKAV